MTKKSNLYLFTFLSIFFSLVLVGAVLSPLFLKMIRSTYLVMNMDVNRRQAEVVANIMGKLLKEGEDQTDIITAFQASLAKTNMDTTYLCLVDANTNMFLAHPLTNLIGKSANQFIHNYSVASQNFAKRRGNAIPGNKPNPGAILKMSGGRTEIVNSIIVPGTHLEVFSHENINLLNHNIALYQKGFIIVFMLLGFVVAFPASYAALRVSRRYEKEIEVEQAKSERLLLNILPTSIAKRLKAEERNIANRYDDVSVLFIDMVNFTPLAATMTPEELVELLNHIFSRFDAISVKFGLEKIKTIGDAYMVVGGIPEPKKDHLKCCIEAGLEMMAFIKSEYTTVNKLEVRMGLHVGPVVAGVIGSYKFIYDLWGETVNIASRLESTSLPGYIHCSEIVYEREKNTFKFTPRGKTLLKGMGQVTTYFLTE